MAWPILLAHWWLRRQTFSPNVRFSHFFYPAPSCWLAVGSQAMQKLVHSRVSFSFFEF